MDVKTAFLHGSLKEDVSMLMILSLVLQTLVNQSPHGIFIIQSNYVLEILKKYGMETCDPIGTPLEIKDKLELDKNGALVDATKYQSMISAIMYLTSSRPDIVHATCLCARYKAQPTKKHLKEFKRIFRYLQGTVNMGLWYTKDSGYELPRFLDVDYAGVILFSIYIGDGNPSRVNMKQLCGRLLARFYMNQACVNWISILVQVMRTCKHGESVE
ncbi:hypothetical protein Tco_0617283 [Tanacetum coccineum]